jgi:hypothetical protein
MATLDTVADRQAQWSKTADHLKSIIDKARWWVARAIAERLKREAYKFAARAAPYGDLDPAKRDSALNDERAKIEADGDDLVQHLVKEAGPGSTPRTTISDADYLEKRVAGQVRWYNDKADRYEAIAKRLHMIELILAAAATLITAIAGVTGKSVLGIPFEAAKAIHPAPALE